MPAYKPGLSRIGPEDLGYLTCVQFLKCETLTDINIRKLSQGMSQGDSKYDIDIYDLSETLYLFSGHLSRQMSLDKCLEKISRKNI